MTITFKIDREPLASPRPKFTMAFGYPKAYFPKAYTIEKEIVKELFQSDYGTELGVYNGNVEIEIEFLFPFPQKTFKGVSGEKATVAKELFCLYPHNQKPDVDNLVKTYLDALNGVAWEDDKQISKLTVSKKWSFTPNVIIKICYTEIENKREIEYFNDVKAEKEKEYINKVYNERKAKKSVH